MNELNEEKQELIEESRKKNAEIKALKDELNQLTTEKDQLQHQINNMQQQIMEIKIKRERAQAESDNALKEIQEGNLTLLDPEEVADVKPKKLAQLVENKIIEMRKLEPVNMKALEEYKKENQRYEELIETRDLLLEERQLIKDTLEQIEAEKRATFMKTFNAIAKEFRALFKEIAAGTGRLYLENPDDPFEGGVFIEANPSGKKISSLEAMSGGEKALTALAFIFAIQKVDAQPFYVLDEIDAALDPMNVRRVAKLLHRLSREVGSDRDHDGGGPSPSVQFLVISHRDILLSYADRLYGVSNVNGLSQMYLLDMSGEDGIKKVAELTEKAKASKN